MVEIFCLIPFTLRSPLSELILEIFSSMMARPKRRDRKMDEYFSISDCGQSHEIKIRSRLEIVDDWKLRLHTIN